MDIVERLKAAIVEMVEGDAKLGDRSQIIGASEVGVCGRLVVHRKINKESLSPDSAGRMLRGKVQENALVQACRKVIDGVKATGRKQVELRHDRVALVCHPDGLLPDATLEIKTAGYAYRKYAEKLPIYYEDQACVAAGLAEKKGTLLVLANAENLGEISTFYLPYHETRFQNLVLRAEDLLRHIAEKTLPEGEPERGSCASCPIRRDCTARSIALAEKKEGELPLSVLLDAEAMVDELRTVRDTRSKETIDREKELKEQLKELLAPTGVRESEIAGVPVSLAPVKGRESLDTKALKADQPDIYAQYLKVSLPSVRLELVWNEQ